MLNLKFVAKLHPDGSPPETIAVVKATGQELSACDTLKPFRQLLRLDLTDNKFVELGGLSASTSLKWLSLANNQLTTVPKMDIPELQVLNIGGNKLSGLLRIKGVPKLRALIANDNAITVVKGLGRLPDLNTLVLKSNSITELGDTLRGCPALEKLSLANNEISQLDDSLSALPQLQELRMGHNELTELTHHLTANTRLKIVDVSGNPIRSLADIQVLAKLPLLQQLGVKGCKMTSGDEAQSAALLAQLPLLEILDGQRVRQRIRGRMPPKNTAAESKPTLESKPATSEPPAAGTIVKGKRKGPEKLAQQRQLREAEGAGDPASQPLRQDGKAQRQTAASIAQRHKKQPSPEAGGTSQAVGDAVEPSDSDSDDGGPAAEDLGGGAGGARSFLHEVLAVDESARKQKNKRGNRLTSSETGLLEVISAAEGKNPAPHKTPKKRRTAPAAKVVPKGTARTQAFGGGKDLSGSGVAAMLSSSAGLLPQIGTGTSNGWGVESAADES